MNYKLSLVIPIYKVEKYLDRCLKSVVQEIDENLEIILVDDGSPDACPIICDSYAEKFKNITVIHKANGGLADAVRVGTIASSGDYIAYVDSDDWLEDGWYQYIKSILASYPAIDVIAYRFHRITQGVAEPCKPYSQFCEGLYDSTSIDKIKKSYLKPGGFGPARWNKVYSRAIAMKCLEYYDRRLSIGEDMVFSSIACDLMKRVYISNKCLVNYYINEGSMTQHFNEKFITSFDVLYRSLEQYFGNSQILSYIGYINTRTVINALAKSDMNSKRNYLFKYLSRKDIHERLQKVDKNDLDFSNRVLLHLILKRNAGVLLLVSAIYRIAK